MKPVTIPLRAAVATAALLAAAVSAQGIAPVTDINRAATPFSSSPRTGAFGNGTEPQNPTFARLAGLSFFAATSRAHGLEVYRAPSPTTGGVERLTDIAPGPLGSNPNGFAIIGNLVFFSARSSALDFELYVLDGTANRPQARLVRDIAPGPEGSRPRFLTPFGGELFFAAADVAADEELWKSDGTAAGTVKLLDIFPGSLPSGPRYFTEFAGALYFSAMSPNGRELWVTDGTPGGTQEIELVPGVAGSSPQDLIVFNGALYFSASTPATGRELWRYTPAGGVALVHDLRAGPGASGPENFVLWRNELYFTANGDDPSGSLTGPELWRTDGVRAQVFEVRPGPTGSNVRFLTPFGTAPNDRLAFTAIRPSIQDNELMVFDGSTITMIDVRFGNDSSAPRELYAHQGGLLFSAVGVIGGRELFRTDGTAGGTLAVADIHPAGDSWPATFTPWPLGGALFSADDGVHGRELWLTDGTPAGTSLLADLEPAIKTAGAQPRHLVDAHGVAYFSADDGVHGRELWRSDGTAAGTRRVADLEPGPGGSDPRELVVVGPRLFFAATTGALGDELFAVDLRNDLVTAIDIEPGPAGSAPFFLVPYRGEVWFGAATAATGVELFASDGTVGGTRLVRDIAPGATGSEPEYMTEYRGALYFAATDATHGRELWATDGTAQGTRLAFDLVPGAGGSSPSRLTRLGDRLVYVAATPATGSEIAISDGTLAGTAIADVEPGGGGSVPVAPYTPTGRDAHLAVAGGLAYFLADANGSGFELYRTDGTVAGTHITRDIPGPAFGSLPDSFAAAGDRLLFRAREPATGQELWSSDGTAAGTVPVADLRPGQADGFPRGLTEAGTRRVVFAADSIDGNGLPTGPELFASDGSQGGTRRVAIIDPGPNGGDPEHFVLVGGRLFFAARHDLLGTELYAIDLDAVAYRAGGGCGGPRSAPSLTVADPVLGGASTFALSGAPPNRAVALALGVPAASARLIDFGGGCVFGLDLARALGVAALATGAGGGFAVAVPVPNDPSLNGVLLGTQAVVGPTNAPLGADLSDLVVLRPGT